MPPPVLTPPKNIVLALGSELEFTLKFEFVEPRSSKDILILEEVQPMLLPQAILLFDVARAAVSGNFLAIADVELAEVYFLEMSKFFTFSETARRLKKEKIRNYKYKYKENNNNNIS